MGEEEKLNLEYKFSNTLKNYEEEMLKLEQ